MDDEHEGDPMEGMVWAFLGSALFFGLVGFAIWAIWH